MLRAGGVRDTIPSCYRPLAVLTLNVSLTYHPHTRQAHRTRQCGRSFVGERGGGADKVGFVESLL